MDTCWKCGATLSAGLEWCGRCLARVVREPGAHDDLALELGELRIVHASTSLPSVRLRRPAMTAPAYQPRSLGSGTASKVVMTATILAAGAGLYTVAAILGRVTGPAMLALMMLIVAAYTIVGGFMVWSVWKDESRPRLLAADDEVAAFRPAHRRADDFTSPVH